MIIRESTHCNEHDGYSDPTLVLGDLWLLSVESFVSIETELTVENVISDWGGTRIVPSLSASCVGREVTKWMRELNSLAGRPWILVLIFLFFFFLLLFTYFFSSSTYLCWHWFWASSYILKEVQLLRTILNRTAPTHRPHRYACKRGCLVTLTRFGRCSFMR